MDIFESEEDKKVFTERMGKKNALQNESFAVQKQKKTGHDLAMMHFKRFYLLNSHKKRIRTHRFITKQSGSVTFGDPLGNLNHVFRRRTAMIVS